MKHISPFYILIQRCSMSSLSIFFEGANIYWHSQMNPGYNSFLQFWKPISTRKYLFSGESKIALIVRFRKVFAFRTWVSFLSEICLALEGCSCVRGLDIGAGINREPFLTNFWARGEIAEKLQLKNCARTAKWEKFSRRRRMALMMKALILDLHKNMRE